MAKQIIGVLIKKDAFLFAQAPQSQTIECEGAILEDIGWAVPITDNNGLVVDYQKILQVPAKPTIDSIRIAIITLADSSTIWLVVSDTATNATFTDKCNACCGTTPVMDTVVIYPPVQEICPCYETDGITKKFSWPLPYNPNSLSMLLAGTFDGVAGTPPYGGAGLADGAAVLAYLTGNWTAYGTWTLVSGVIKLSSTTVNCASLSMPLVPVTYCLSVPTGTTTADSIIIGGNTVMFPGGAITFNSANPTGLQYVLAQLLIGVLGTTVGSPSKLTYTGLQVPVKIQNAGVDVAGMAFSAGVCSWTFDFAVPADIGNYSVTLPKFNGVDATPTIVGQAFATAALMLTWVQANWGAYGTWSLQSGNTILRLVGSVTYSATNLTITSA